MSGISPSERAGAAVGVDVGGTKVAAGVVDGTAVANRLERPTNLTSGEALLAEVEEVVREVSDRASEVAAVGVGLPSQIEFATGLVVSSVNIPLAGVSVKDELERRLGTPVFVDNDANCAALAESRLADGGPARHLVMLTLGTGVGGGIVVDGRIYRGNSGLGAELGHIVIDENGPECPGTCPSRGCLEAFCSGTALERDANELGRDRPEGVIGGLVAREGRVRGPDVVDAARAGDEDARGLFTRLGTHLGVGLAGLINAFEPELIVIGGGMSQAADLFLDEARREAASRALPAIFERVSISLARGGADAGVIGAGTLAAQETAAAGGPAHKTATEGER